MAKILKGQEQSTGFLREAQAAGMKHWRSNHNIIFNIILGNRVGFLLEMGNLTGLAEVIGLW
jgi:hypothetical protein